MVEPLSRSAPCRSGRSPTTPGCRSGWSTATSTRSRPSVPRSRRATSSPMASTASRSEPGGKKKDEAELFAQPSSLFRELRPLLSSGDFYWQSAVALRAPGRAPAAPVPQRLHPRAGHGPAPVLEVVPAAYFFGVDERGPAPERGPHPAAPPGLRRLPRRSCAPRVGAGHGRDRRLGPRPRPDDPPRDFYTQHRHGPPGILLMQGGPVKPGHAIRGRGHLRPLPDDALPAGAARAGGRGGQGPARRARSGVRARATRCARSRPTRSSGRPAACPAAGAESGMNERGAREAQGARVYLMHDRIPLSETSA